MVYDGPGLVRSGRDTLAPKIGFRGAGALFFLEPVYFILRNMCGVGQALARGLRKPVQCVLEQAALARRRAKTNQGSAKEESCKQLGVGWRRILFAHPRGLTQNDEQLLADSKKPARIAPDGPLVSGFASA